MPYTISVFFLLYGNGIFIQLAVHWHNIIAYDRYTKQDTQILNSTITRLTLELVPANKKKISKKEEKNSVFFSTKILFDIKTTTLYNVPVYRPFNGCTMSFSLLEQSYLDHLVYMYSEKRV